MKKYPVFVIYIGTTKLVAIQGAVQDDGVLTIERFIKTPAIGFNKGLVTDIEKASVQLKTLVKELNPDIDYTKCDFNIVLSNDRLRNYTCSSSIYFGDLLKTITHNDILRVIAQTKSVATIPLNEYIIENAPQEFIVNDLDGIIEPLELEARRLGVKLLVFTVDVTVIRNIQKVLERADVSAFTFIPKVLSSSYSVLREEEKRDGVVLIDIGGDVTDIIYMRNGIMQFYETLPLGGEYMSGYLAERLNIPVLEARRLKERFGSAVLVSSFEDEIIPVVDIFGKTKLSLNKKRLYDHLFMATKDLLEKIKPTIEKIRRKSGLVGGIVLTGGTISLEGFLELSQEILQSPVRLGIPRKIRGPKEVISSPMYGGATGVLGYTLDQLKKQTEQYSNKPFIMRKIIQVREWIQENF